MLFLVKRSWRTGLKALVLLALPGLGLRGLLAAVPPLDVSGTTLLLGAGLFLGVLTSDVIVHGVLCLLFGDSYRARHRELAAVFRGQSLAAIVLGALVAGVGEELLFRGLSFSLVYLAVGAIVFGLLHHVRRSLWIFTPWAAYQGCLLSAGLLLTGSLGVTMIAHFLHDLTGFLLFRYLNRTATRDPAIAALTGPP